MRRVREVREVREVRKVRKVCEVRGVLGVRGVRGVLREERSASNRTRPRQFREHPAASVPRDRHRQR